MPDRATVAWWVVWWWCLVAGRYRCEVRMEHSAEEMRCELPADLDRAAPRHGRCSAGRGVPVRGEVAIAGADHS